MVYTHALYVKKDFEIMAADRFNPAWNPHYDFSNPDNIREIERVETYRLEMDDADYTSGQNVDSPWGSNQVLEAKQENGIDVCIKRITVKPGYMLSLQRHRGREELWEVKDGTLTVILDGKRYDVPAGQSISMHRGAVHCMINSSDAPVTVLETQSGVCREEDNVRLIDFNARPTYPLTSEVEFASALLYAAIQSDHAARYGFQNRPHDALLK